MNDYSYATDYIGAMTFALLNRNKGHLAEKAQQLMYGLDPALVPEQVARPYSDLIETLDSANAPVTTLDNDHAHVTQLSEVRELKLSNPKPGVYNPKPGF